MMDEATITDRTLHFRLNRELLKDGKRRCWRCKETLSLECFARDRERYSGVCRVCEASNGDAVARKIRNEELRRRGLKECLRCGNTHPLADYEMPSHEASYCRGCRIELKRNARRAKGARSIEEVHDAAAVRRARIAEERARAKAAKPYGPPRPPNDILYPLEYYTWQSMIQRCTRSTHPKFKRYGGRGIQVCDRWRSSFAAFLHDVGPKPAPWLSIDRINNDGNYEPGNVRWADNYTQQHNKSGRAA